MNKQKKIIVALLILVSLGLLVWKYGEVFRGRFIDKCSRISSEAEKINCWKDEVELKLNKGGLDESLDIVALLYDTDPAFAPVCHDFVHLIGKKAYTLFEQGKDFKLSSKASYCAYGFYHGFMESMVSSKGDVSEAREFCKYVDAQLSKTSPSARLACYHGIGHGWSNVHDERLWGDERAMVYPALELCEKVTEDPEELKICATGIFDSISIGYYNEAYGLKINRDDPYFLCKEQREVYKAPCYMDLSPAIVWLSGNNLDKSIDYISTVELSYRDLVVETLAENIVRHIIRNNAETERAVMTCRELVGTQSDACIRGLSGGHLQFGDPGKEYLSATSFCNSGFLTEEERVICYTRFLRDLSVGVPQEKYTKICESLGEYKRFCISP